MRVQFTLGNLKLCDPVAQDLYWDLPAKLHTQMKSQSPNHRNITTLAQKYNTTHSSQTCGSCRAESRTLRHDPVRANTDGPRQIGRSTRLTRHEQSQRSWRGDDTYEGKSKQRLKAGRVLGREENRESLTRRAEELSRESSRGRTTAGGKKLGT
jgi:hypothetical protein